MEVIWKEGCLYLFTYYMCFLTCILQYFKVLCKHIICLCVYLVDIHRFILETHVLYVQELC